MVPYVATAVLIALYGAVWVPVCVHMSQVDGAPSWVAGILVGIFVLFALFPINFVYWMVSAITKELSTERTGVWRQGLHGVSGFLHLGSAAFILAYGVHSAPHRSTGKSIEYYNIDILKRGIEEWGCICVEPLGGAFNQVGTCTADADVSSTDCPKGSQESYYVDTPRTGMEFNPLLAAFGFAFVSGFFHVVCALSLRTNPEASVEQYKWWDYTFSASLMLAVVNSVFGFRTYTAIVVLPVSLGLLLIASGFVERWTDMQAMNIIDGRREVYYCLASLIAKTTLHAYLSLFVVDNRQSLNNNLEESLKRGGFDDDTGRDTWLPYVVASGVVGSVLTIFLIVWHCAGAKNQLRVRVKLPDAEGGYYKKLLWVKIPLSTPLGSNWF